MLAIIRAFMRLATIYPIPGGIQPDNQGMWGHFRLGANVNAALPNNVTTLSSANVALALSASQLVSGLLSFTGAPGGGVTATSPSGKAIISFFGPTVPTDGTFCSRVRLQNACGQTITVAGSAGVGTTGTMTITDGSFRDFLLQVGSSSTVTIRNYGGGTT